ncbi:MAG: hypothetical protein HOJ35_11295 [Bdellovibrionales bacterium]|jgi:hypothetical protein|nr:hypothetical protein [Bdellovibrionales bacterium]
MSETKDRILFYIGLTFQQNHLQFKNIDSFRKRFDNRYSDSKTLNMSILPPFQLAMRQGESQVLDLIIDEVENQFLGHDNIHPINFNFLDFKVGKKCGLYLVPELSINLLHLQEALIEALNSHSVIFKQRNKKDQKNAFLPIGRFRTENELSFGIDIAKTQLRLPLSLQPKHLCLFEQTNSDQVMRKKIFSFGNIYSDYTQSLLWENHLN